MFSFSRASDDFSLRKYGDTETIQGLDQMSQVGTEGLQPPIVENKWELAAVQKEVP